MLAGSNTYSTLPLDSERLRDQLFLEVGGPCGSSRWHEALVGITTLG